MKRAIIIFSAMLLILSSLAYAQTYTTIDSSWWTTGDTNSRDTYSDPASEDRSSEETYFILDDIRFPSGDLDGYWDFNDGDSVERTTSYVLTRITRWWSWLWTLV